MKLTNMQEKARARFQQFLERKAIESQSGPVSPLVISKFETVDYHGMIWIRAELDRAGLPENNVLRFLDHQHWHVLIGPRGGIEVKDAPKEYRQFKGRYAFRMLFTF